MKYLNHELLLYRNISVLEDLFQNIRLTDELYDSAKRKYTDLGIWLSKTEALAAFEPDIFPQGSFELQTAIKPFGIKVNFDVDLVCNLTEGYSHHDFSQFGLKEKVGCALREYTREHGIKDPVTAKNHCWAITYNDSVNFHMDILPCIPGREDGILLITDESHPSYKSICGNWLESNPRSYADWFARKSRENHPWGFIDSKFSDLTIRQKPSRLMKIVMLLKRHRDAICQNDLNLKPSSIIITTLATESYSGERSFLLSFEMAILKIIDFSHKINIGPPELFNPKNENENFTRDWSSKHCSVFTKWSCALVNDFMIDLGNSRNDGKFWQLYKKLDVPMDDSLIKKFQSLGIEINACHQAIKYKLS